MECNTNDTSSIWRMICNGEIDMFVEHWTHESVETRGKPRGSLPLQCRASRCCGQKATFLKDNTDIFLKKKPLWEEKTPYKSDVESLILDGTKPQKLCGKHAVLKELQL